MGRKLKKIGFISVLVAAIALSGCSTTDSGEVSEQTESSPSLESSPSSSSRISDGSVVKKASDVVIDGICNTADLQDTTYFKYYAECSTGQVAAEFADDADQNFVVEKLIQEREDRGFFNPWLVGDGWAFQTWADDVNDARKRNPGSEVKMSLNSTMFVYDQMDLIVAAIEERSGAECKINEIAGSNAEIVYKCMKGKKDFYTVAEIYTKNKSKHLDETLEKTSMIFKGADREAFSVRTDNWYIHDVSKADASWYAKNLDGEVIDLSDLD